MFGTKTPVAVSTLPSVQTLMVVLDASNLPQEIYDEHDLSTLEDQILDAIKGTTFGKLDGNEVGEGVVTLFFNSSDAERLLQRIEPVLRANPLCQGATVVIRQGPSGALERTVRL